MNHRALREAPPQAIGSRRELIRRLLLPSLAVALLTAGAALYLGTLSDSPFQLTIFFYLFRTNEGIAAGLYAGTLIAAFVLCRRLPADRLQAALAAFEARPWAPLGMLFVLLAAATLFVYRSHPLSMDEYAALFQAEIFASGKLVGRFPPELVPWLIPDFFVDYFFTVSGDGRVLSRYLPGFSLMLAPFVRLGAPWLLNPLLVVASLLLLRGLGRQLAPGTNAAAWAMLLAIASPQFLVYGISYYSMTAHLCANLLYVWLLLRPDAIRLVAAGLVGSFALALHQPLPHFLFALPWIVWLAVRSGDRLRRLLLLGLGYLPLTLLLVFGSYSLQSRLGNGDGGGAAVGGLVTFWTLVGNAFSIPGGWTLASRALEILVLFLWAVPGLPILAYGGLRKGEAPGGQAAGSATPVAARLIGLSFLLTAAGLLVVPFDQGHGWGHRYSHSAWAALPLLAALFLTVRSRNRSIWKRYVAALAVLTLATAVPLRFYQVQTFIDHQLAQLPPIEETWPGSVLFLGVHRGYYAADLVQNDPFLRDPHWILVSHGREQDEAFIRNLDPNPRLVRDNGFESQWVVDWSAWTERAVSGAGSASD